VTQSILGVDSWIFLDRKECQKWQNIKRKFGMMSSSAVHRPGIEGRVVDTCLTLTRSLRSMHLEFGFTSLLALSSSQFYRLLRLALVNNHE
jgi:hypothetical protein